MLTRSVVAGTTGTRPDPAVAAWAAREAVLRVLPLRLVHVAPSAAAPAGEGAPAVRDAVAELARRHPGLDVTGEQVTGALAAALARAGRDAEVLVLQAGGDGAALDAAGRAPCPAVLVPGCGADGERPARKAAHGAPGVVLGIDARHPDDRAAAFAFEAAAWRGTGVRAVHAWRLPAAPGARRPYPVLEEDRGAWEDDETQLLDDALRGWRDTYPAVPVLPDVRLLPPADALVGASAGADLLVVGRGSRAEGAQPPGVPHTVARQAACPVAVVPKSA